MQALLNCYSLWLRVACWVVMAEWVSAICIYVIVLRLPLQAPCLLDRPIFRTYYATWNLSIPNELQYAILTCITFINCSISKKPRVALHINWNSIIVSWQRSSVLAKCSISYCREVKQLCAYVSAPFISSFPSLSELQHTWLNSQCLVDRLLYQCTVWQWNSHFHSSLKCVLWIYILDWLLHLVLHQADYLVNLPLNASSWVQCLAHREA